MRPPHRSAPSSGQEKEAGVGRYLIRRALFMILVIMIVSFLTFLIFVKLPAGDPARRAVGRTTTPEQIENARVAFGLDKPLYVQYWRFLKGFIPYPGLWLNEEVYFSYGSFEPGEGRAARGGSRSPASWRSAPR